MSFYYNIYQINIVIAELYMIQVCRLIAISQNRPSVIKIATMKYNRIDIK
jgi:hypothetical protein